MTEKSSSPGNFLVYEARGLVKQFDGGHVAALRGQLDAAAAAYRDAARIAPDRALPYVGLGGVLTRLGRADDALGTQPRYEPKRKGAAAMTNQDSEQHQTAGPPAYSNEALVLQFATKHRDRPRYMTRRGEWMVFDDACWRQGGPG